MHRRGEIWERSWKREERGTGKGSALRNVSSKESQSTTDSAVNMHIFVLMLSLIHI